MPDTDQTMGTLLQGIYDDMGDVVLDAMSHVAGKVKEGMKTVVEVGGRKVLELGEGALAVGQEVSATCWSWWGREPTAKAAKLAPAEYRIRAKIMQAAQEIERLHYGIGGFYHLEPEGAALSALAVLTIPYTDEEVVEIDENALRVYRWNEARGRWQLVGGTVYPDSNFVRATIDTLWTFTLAPTFPSGSFDLIPDMGQIPADTTSTVWVSSTPILNNDSTAVADGMLFTVTAHGGAILTGDEDVGRIGIQVASSGGVIGFLFRSDPVARTIGLHAQSVIGQAIGEGTITLSDTTAPTAPTGLYASLSDEAISLHWNANTEVDLAGYSVYYDTIPGPPYTGTATIEGLPSPIVIGTDTSLAIVGLTNGHTYHIAVTAYDVAGNESDYSKAIAQIIPTAVNEETTVSLPREYFLYQSSPNPFNASTEIRFELPKISDVRLVVYDITGRMVRTLVDDSYPAGTHLVLWDGKDQDGRPVGSGIYLYRLKAGSFTQTLKALLLR